MRPRRQPVAVLTSRPFTPPFAAAASPARCPPEGPSERPPAGSGFQGAKRPGGVSKGAKPIGRSGDNEENPPGFRRYVRVG